MKKIFFTVLGIMASCLFLMQDVMAAKGIYVPLFTYRTGPLQVVAFPMRMGCMIT